MIDYIKEPCLIIGKYDYGEADRCLIGFTKERGKIEFFVKGIRKTKKREISSADILTLSNVEYYKKRETYAIKNIISIDSFMEIKENLDNLSTALYILSILNQILMQDNPKEKLYNITLKSLNFLKNNQNEEQNYLLILYYLYYVIKDEGLKISITQGNFFSFEDLRFYESIDSSLELKNSEKEILEKIVNGKMNVLKKEKNDIYSLKKIIRLLETSLNHQFDINLNFKNYTMGVE